MTSVPLSVTDFVEDPMNLLANKTVSINGVGSTDSQSVFRRSIDLLANVLTRLGLLRDDADYHLLRAAMVIILFFSVTRSGLPTRWTD
jgi:hypothetical protein